MSDAIKIIADNRRARFEFAIDERFEAGLVLTGTEVKSLRAGKANLGDAFGGFKAGELYLYQAHIPPYTFGNRENHDPMRPRKLLLNRREIKQIDLALAQKGYTLVPLKLYFKMGRVKVELGLGKGKKLHDKRSTIQDRETKIKLDRIRKGDRNEA